METAAGTVMMTFETLGVLVHNRVVPIDLVDQVIGGFLVAAAAQLHELVDGHQGTDDEGDLADELEIGEDLRRVHRRVGRRGGGT